MKAQEWLNQTVTAGGVPIKLGTLIREMQAEGHSQAYIDRYFQGLLHPSKDRVRRVSGRPHGSLFADTV